MEFTQENFDKLLKTAEEVENYKKALKEEREKRKQETEDKENMKTQLSELQDFKKDLEEKEAKKKGKYEDLILEKDNQIKELSEKISWIETKATKYDEFLTKNLDEKMSKIPDEKKEFIKKVLDWKPHDEQLTLLDGFIEDYSNPDFKAKPKNEWEEIKNTTEYEKAKKEGNVMGLIKNAPEIKDE
jgi:chromosome segregation ATPase